MQGRDPCYLALVSIQTPQSNPNLDSLYSRLAALPEEGRAKILAGLPDDLLEEVMGDWRVLARKAQTEPEGDWTFWEFLGGVGAGKSRTGSEWVHDRILQHRDAGNTDRHYIGIVGRTSSDVRDVMVEGESGLMAVAELRGVAARYEPSKRRIVWPDLNAWATTFTAEEPNQLRGPQFHTAWADEVGAWDPNKVDDVGNTAWTNLKARMRLGLKPRVLVTTTPKRTPVIKEITRRAQDPLNTAYVMTRSSSIDNAANLAPAYLDDIISDYEGTQLYDQEILGLLLDDADLTLWTDEMVAATHRFDHDPDSVPKITRKVVAVDPPGKDGGDECGIVAVGVLAGPLEGQLATKKRSIIVLADRSLQGTSEKWAQKVVDLCEELSINRITYENNKVGDAVETIIRNLSSGSRFTFDPVFATDSKYLRAEPVSQIYEQHRVVHAKDGLETLEKQMVDFQADMRDSPDRVDALVHGVTNLLPAINTRPVTIGTSNAKIVRKPANPRPAPRATRPSVTRTLAGLDTSHYRDVMKKVRGG